MGRPRKRRWRRADASMARLMPHRGWTGLVLASFAVLAGCGGGRTELLPRTAALDACAHAGHQRTCGNACGSGRQTCQNGFWQACEVPLVTRTCSSACGAGIETCQDGTWGPCIEACATVCGQGRRRCQNGVWGNCDAPSPKSPSLPAILRDFHKTHPDFERPGSGDLSELGIVAPILGSDDTPSYAHAEGTNTVTGPESFAQWYHDVPGVNVAIPYEIPLEISTPNPGFYEFLGKNFFPLDGDPRGFGDEEQEHDFDFTLATQFTFHYQGGELFRFTGDDDLWVFVNRHLAIDLGGLHQSKTGEVMLDHRAAEFDITPGNTYQLHLFFAERHMKDSDFSIETTIADPGTCD
jgi:fibro-slime domain-containing protein